MKVIKIHVDDYDLYIAKMEDSTHLKMSLKEFNPEIPYTYQIFHVGQLNQRPFYLDVCEWLRDPTYNINGNVYKSN